MSRQARANQKKKKREKKGEKSKKKKVENKKKIYKNREKKRVAGAVATMDNATWRHRKDRRRDGGTLRSSPSAFVTNSTVRSLHPRCWKPN